MRFKYIWRHRGIMIIILLLIAGTGYYLWLHRFPFTQNAFIVADTRAVSALVEGYITDIYVKNNQSVCKGDPLFTVYKRPYELKVEELKNALDAEKYNQKGIEFSIKSLEALVKEKTSVMNNAQYLSNQANQLYKNNATSEKDMEEKLRQYEETQDQLTQAMNNLDSMKQQYLESAANQLKLQSQIDIAQVNLDLTTVKALADGNVTNMFMTPGAYVKPGDILFAFIATDTWWVQANFKETELATLKPGQKVKIWLWQYPGKEFSGIVDDAGWGVDRKISSSPTGMTVVQKENEWFLLPQRFPVQIKITDLDPAYLFHPGASAFVQVQTPASPLRQFIWQLFQY